MALQVAQWAVAVHPFAEVNLGDASETAAAVDVDEEPDLNPVAVGESNALERRAPDGTLPRPVVGTPR